MRKNNLSLGFLNIYYLLFLGGTWGAKLDYPPARKAWVGSFNRLVKDALSYSPRTKAGPDQAVIMK